MLKLCFSGLVDPAPRILCLGAHSDDIEIGCGGTVLRLLESHPHAEFCWVVFSADQQRASEARNSATRFLKHGKAKQIIIKDFRESFFPYLGSTIKEYFEHLQRNFSPNLIFTHYRDDLHQDHRVISELTRNTFRNHLILEYEIPKYDGDLGSPNAFVPLEEPICRTKLQYILDGFPSQRHRPWFDQETFSALLRLRGMECNAMSRYAEAFYCKKAVLALAGWQS